MTIYHVLASASTGTMLAFAAVIVMVVAAVACFSMIAYALDTQDNETAREVLRLGARALGELEAARADILRLAAKVDASEKPDSLMSGDQPPAPRPNTGLANVLRIDGVSAFFG